ncbi:MAG: YwiC-like family protein [Candidatus Promineifilaceae bacterium]|nr:YwiC-like family protein [Candidatus Promineifilaceae bacterium]
MATNAASKSGKNGVQKAPKKRKKKKGRIFRKSLVVPAEHGSWFWLLVPFFVGAAVGANVNVAVFLTLTGGLAGFLMRQPATAWMNIRRGRGRQRDEPLAAGWTISFGLLALLSLAGLLALGHAALLWLLAPPAAMLALYLGVARVQRARVRNLWLEVAGAAGLALMAPAAYVAASDHLDQTAWALWGLMAAQNVLSVLYVRLRLADTHSRPAKRAFVLGSHTLGVLLAAVAAAASAIPWLAVALYGGYLLRAAWAVSARRPVEDVKRFGFTEVGVETAGGLWIIASYLFFG